jgi:hypothetical protein
MLPQLDLHFSGRHLSPSLFSTQWYLTLFQHEFQKDFSLGFLFLFGLSDEPGQLMLQVAIQLMRDFQSQILQTRDPDECIGLLKDILPQSASLAQLADATAIKAVSVSRMGDLEELWKRQKGHKRVLFVKESSLGINHEITTDRTILKTLPNLPDDDEDVTQRELDEQENQ